MTRHGYDPDDLFLGINSSGSQNPWTMQEGLTFFEPWDPLRAQFTAEAVRSLLRVNPGMTAEQANERARTMWYNWKTTGDFIYHNDPAFQLRWLGIYEDIKARNTQDPPHEAL